MESWVLFDFFVVLGLFSFVAVFCEDFSGWLRYQDILVGNQFNLHELKTCSSDVIGWWYPTSVWRYLDLNSSRWTETGISKWCPPGESWNTESPPPPPTQWTTLGTTPQTTLHIFRVRVSNFDEFQLWWMNINWCGKLNRLYSCANKRPNSGPCWLFHSVIYLV